MGQQAAAPLLSAWQCGGALELVEGVAGGGCLQVAVPGWWLQLPGSAALTEHGAGGPALHQSICQAYVSMQICSVWHHCGYKHVLSMWTCHCRHLQHP